MADVRDASAGHRSDGARPVEVPAPRGQQRRDAVGLGHVALGRHPHDAERQLLARPDDARSPTSCRSAGRRCTPTGDYPARWGWVEPDRRTGGTSRCRRSSTSPARLAAQMWKARTGEDVDGVLALDPIALRALVKVSGPVDVQGTHIDADNIVQRDPAPAVRRLRQGEPERRRRRAGEPGSAGSATATSPGPSSTSSTRSAGTSRTSSTTCGRRHAAATCCSGRRSPSSSGRGRRPASPGVLPARRR